MNEDLGHFLATRMAQLAREVAAPRSAEEVLETVTSAARELIPGVTEAAVLLISRGGKFETHAGTSALAQRLDLLQETFGEGPCLEAAVDELIVRTEDFEKEPRWPRYSRAVFDLGIRSALSFKLYTSAQTAGALNLFSDTANVFTSQAEAIGSVLAAHAAAAILASRHGEQLESALASRDLIGQAKGIIMQVYKVDAIRAFEMMRRLSQDSNTRLVEIAQRVVDSRDE
ncbi:GAF and ANTAR domain-containing protein [Mycobacterium sp.]|uniref:GAF and ANTAR domain-containing protein n=1 Tax=Mycobacterium sp. TaxID=1785 RepID=UPI002C1D9FB7|nr:GAF and ANTAR domain-containing protein [Mycobacterium sp.]HME48207.1 GAF and ANTAR domain-containing protein [Mycobacterium sp.]